MENTRDFSMLADEWRDLFDHSSAATPFQSWEWLYSWWEHYGSGRALRIVTLRERDGGKLVGLMPLMIERRPGFGRLLLFIGTGITDHLDVLARSGWENEVTLTGTRVLREMGSWDVADLQELQPEALAWDLFQRWTGYKAQAEQSKCPVLPVMPWDEMLSSVTKNLRKMARRTLRRMDEDGVHHKMVDPDDTDRATRVLVALHRESWEGREIDPTHLTQDFEAQMTSIIKRIVASDYGGVSEFWQDGEVIISLFWLSHGDFFGSYTVGATQDALQRYQVSSALQHHELVVCRSRNNKFLSMLRGEEPYKLRWNPEIVANDRVFLGLSPFYARLYVAYRSARSAYTNSAPGRLKDTIRRLRARG